MLGKAKTQSDVNLGENIITVGLGIQIFFFGLFVTVASIFHYRIKAIPSLRSKQLSVPWESYLYVLYIASGLILVRSVFRIIEYAMGSDGVLLKHEYFLYIFDAMLMFVTMVVLNVCHPSRIINKRKTGETILQDLDPHNTEIDSVRRENVPINGKH